MSFIDKVTVSVIAGKGGDGRVSFRQEKFIDKGGPDGGDGGHGGNVVLIASRNQNTLAAFRYQKELKADDGKPGGDRNKHGRSAKHLMVQVPVGTVAYADSGEVIADLIEDGQQAIIGRGGGGGFGNAHFVSSRRQTPRFAEKGEPGEAFEVKLEIKMIADVGLVGLPNAGKSTLLSVVSNARPEIADYPFTTLTPNLGVVDVTSDSSVLFADIPGLIEGAADGKGLGHDFLRHIERTAVIVHLIDAYQDQIAETYQTVKSELAAYANGLDTRPEIVVITKIEGLDADIVADIKQQLRAVVPEPTPIYAISAQAKMGLKEFLFSVQRAVDESRAKLDEIAAEEAASIPVIRLADNSKAWKVSKVEGVYYVAGPRIDHFSNRTDFENEEGIQRLRDIMKRFGILHELVRQGIAPGDTIQFGADESRSFEY